MENTRPGEVLLDVRDVHVAYGKAEVVHGVSMDVRAGEFVVMLGRNGAGKSTLLHAISGLVPMRSGTVRFQGVDISRATPRDIVKAGIVQVLEGHRVFHTLSVEDNLLLGTYAANPRGDRRKLDRIYALFPELAERRHQMASRLSGGQQQILAVGQGVIGDPKLLILDEPSGGLAPLVIDRILEVAADLCKSGLAILLVEQLVEKALRHATYAYLFETGRIAAGAYPRELHEGDLLQRVYLGGGH
ncbi:ABC transporter ATP-binding protein [Hydrogenophaga sp. BPS33]|uniref:ABC transporter ATP-binding protein n=1 Tax=Hydrogenophaga sp. BPS33 TaxID=2651974 RepID=UPI001320455F|nr:ABC transporter ATP-binding protein [Hydrogenophaga sp. BPS33]QHE86894.1 ABC transporter ATP-binding protein [Hydrogenophaga sp. BPS33]